MEITNAFLDKIEEAGVIVNHINSRFKKGLNTNVFIIGLSGTGKSSTSLRTSELIMESRKEEDLKIFIVESLLTLLDAIRKSKPGDIIVIEEVSVLFPSRRAMASDNVAVGKIFDTIRKKRLCLISNAPIWKSIDSHMRAMGHILVETLMINKQFSVVVSKFHRLQTNPGSGKTYRHTMTSKGADVQRMFTRMPCLDRWNAYEKSKDKFMDDLYEKIKHDETKKEKKIQKEMGNAPKPGLKALSKRELEVHDLYNSQKLTQDQVAARLGITQPRIVQILKNIMKKADLPREMANIT